MQKKVAKEEGVNQSFLDDFVTDKTTAEFCKSITECSSVKQGNSFMGAVTLTDMPFVGNAECRVDVIHSQLGGFILALELISATEIPYRWYGVYWKAFGGWQALITDAHLQEEYTIEISENTSEDYAKVYNIKQGKKSIGEIKIPKDMFVTSGQIVDNPEGYPTGKYIELTFANSDNSKVYISVNDLLDVYTAEANAAQIQLKVESGVISAKIVAGSVGLSELNPAVNETLSQAKQHSLSSIASESGSHGLRFWEGNLQYNNGETWETITIPTTSS